MHTKKESGMRNYVAKNAKKFNVSVVMRDRKNNYSRKNKHKKAA